MLRSMFAAVSGLQAHQTFMDVVGNNIANVNTTGFKAGTVEFEDLLSQTLNGAGLPAAGVAGGTNPAQVGLGVRLAGIGTNFSQGAAQETGRSTDFAIQGDGFFVVQQGGASGYTRNGSFSLDGLGQLVTGDGGLVQGWQADPQGNVNTNASHRHREDPGRSDDLPGHDVVDQRRRKPAGRLRGRHEDRRLDRREQQPGRIRAAAHGVHEGRRLGRQHQLDGHDLDSANAAIVGSEQRAVRHERQPHVGEHHAHPGPAQRDPGHFGTWAAGGATMDFGAATDADRLTGAASLNSVAALSQNGSGIGSLVSFSVGQSGLISGVFSNGRTQALGQIALATFANPAGLIKEGGSMFTTSADSGVAEIGVAGVGGRGTLTGGTLEGSNVDLGQEFTNMILAQRGFEANAKVITTSDQLLQDLVNLKQ